MQIKINSLVTPFIDTLPRFSWELAPLAKQTAYTLTLAEDENFEHTVFCVRVETDERANIRHDIALLPRTKYFVRVAAETSDGETQTGETYFCTGFMGEEWDSCTTDGCHPNDLGFHRFALCLEKVIGPLLK